MNKYRIYQCSIVEAENEQRAYEESFPMIGGEDITCIRIELVDDEQEVSQ